MVVFSSTEKQWLLQAQNSMPDVFVWLLQPQHSMPDVFVWMVCDKKRVAYARVPANDLLYATQDDMQGKHCGKIQTLFLRVIT